MEPADALHDDPDLFRQIVEQAPDAVIFADRQGTIRLWNRGAERVFGYAASEVLGSSLDVIIPERLRSGHWSGFDQALKSGQTKYDGQVLTTRSEHKNGSKVYVDLSFSLVRGSTGEVMGALAIARDCTARYLADRALKAHVSELELKCKDGSARTP